MRFKIYKRESELTYKNRKEKLHSCHCTSTDALRRAISTSKVAFQSLCVVTWLRLAAVLKELPCTDSTASTAIQHQTDSCCTSGAVRGTPTVLRAWRWHLRPNTRDISYQSKVSFLPDMHLLSHLKQAAYKTVIVSSPVLRRGSQKQRLSTFSGLQAFFPEFKKKIKCLYQTPDLAVGWRVFALPPLESPSPFIHSEQKWRMCRLKRCSKTMRGMLLHASSHKPIFSSPPLFPSPHLTSSPLTQQSQESLSLTSTLSGLSPRCSHHFLYLFYDHTEEPHVIFSLWSSLKPVSVKRNITNNKRGVDGDLYKCPALDNEMFTIQSNAWQCLQLTALGIILFLFY